MFDQSKHSDGELIFADDDTLSPSERTRKSGEPWNVMIVDDEKAIHDVTKLALQGFEYKNRGLNFIDCYSAIEAKKMLKETSDIALILLDVVMEKDDAGLDVVRYIREELKNKRVRIVLRTGQPGSAPERDVIRDYDINDYKEKTELTAQKLFTVVMASLRSYRDIVSIEESKRGLESVINASANIFELTSFDKFANGVLEQLAALLHINKGAVYLKKGGLAADCRDEVFHIIAGTGIYKDVIGLKANEILDSEKISILEQGKKRKTSSFYNDSFTGFFESHLGGQNLVYFSGLEDINKLDKSLIDLFTKNVSIAYENVHLHADLETTQREIVYLLGEAVETRSKETGNHVKRVAEISRLLALETGLDEEEADLVLFASPLHDLGKIGIPDAILNKPGRHTDEEFDIMKTHAKIGHDMLQGSNRNVLQAGATIALEHHERWDGSGYPFGKEGEDIHVYGRITALADVFDALGSDRCYKKAWPLEKILDLIKEEKGKHFDPHLVDLFFKNINKVMDIISRHPDSMAA